MKNIIRLALYVLCICSFSSCLKMGLDDLPTSDKAEITNVKFEYRWWDESAGQLRVVELLTEKKIADRTISCMVTVPDVTDKFTSTIRDKVALSGIVCTMDISAGASIHSFENAPKLGLPGDFSSKDYTYLVTAANGSEREWKILIVAFNK